MAAKKVIQVAKIPSKKKESHALATVAELCYHYKYPIEYARKLPYKRVALLLKIARRQQALQMAQLTQIAFAPHTKKAALVETLLKHFKEQMNG